MYERGRRSEGRESYGSYGGERMPPVKVDEELEVTIEAVGAKGDGLTRKEGFVIFVPNTSKGDHVRIRITKVLRNMGFAEVVGQAGEQKKAAEQPETPGEAEGQYVEESEEGPEEEKAQYEQQPVDTENFGEEEEK